MPTLPSASSTVPHARRAAGRPTRWPAAAARRRRGRAPGSPASTSRPSDVGAARVQRGGEPAGSAADVEHRAARAVEHGLVRRRSPGRPSGARAASEMRPSAKRISRGCSAASAAGGRAEPVGEQPPGSASTGGGAAAEPTARPRAELRHGAAFRQERAGVRESFGCRPVRIAVRHAAPVTPPLPAAPRAAAPRVVGVVLALAAATFLAYRTKREMSILGNADRLLLEIMGFWVAWAVAVACLRRRRATAGPPGPAARRPRRGRPAAGLDHRRRAAVGRPLPLRLGRQGAGLRHRPLPLPADRGRAAAAARRLAVPGRRGVRRAGPRPRLHAHQPARRAHDLPAAGAAVVPRRAPGRRLAAARTSAGRWSGWSPTSRRSCCSGGCCAPAAGRCGGWRSTPGARSPCSRRCRTATSTGWPPSSSSARSRWPGDGPRWPGAVLGAAAMVKLYPALLLPVLLGRRAGRVVAAFAAVVVRRLPAARARAGRRRARLPARLPRRRRTTAAGGRDPLPAARPARAVRRRWRPSWRGSLGARGGGVRRAARAPQPAGQPTSPRSPACCSARRCSSRRRCSPGTACRSRRWPRWRGARRGSRCRPRRTRCSSRWCPTGRRRRPPGWAASATSLALAVVVAAEVRRRRAAEPRRGRGRTSRATLRRAPTDKDPSA